MLRPKAAPLFSNQPDLGVLTTLGIMHRVLVGLVPALETDVIGLVGGDKFVVAGRIDVLSRESHVRRLEQAVMRENSVPARSIPISFSIGYVESESAIRKP
jgi:hypothetical protein